ncbi:hypothetical protein [Jannaschia sp. M317]|nr:hypothetical protein [Jannaschia sp. M317]
MLICALCPFPAMQPYAETGPIFLHAADCPPGTPTVCRRSSQRRRTT